MKKYAILLGPILVMIVLTPGITVFSTSEPAESCEEANADPDKKYGCHQEGDTCWIFNKETGMQVQLSSCESNQPATP
jgi:hypothetical protein